MLDIPNKALKKVIRTNETKTGRRDVTARRKLNELIAGGRKYCYPHNGYGQKCVRESNNSQLCASTDANGCCPEGCILK